MPLVTPYDLESGFDPSSTNACTLIQFLQAINQIVPLSYIGGIVVSSGATAAGIPDPATYPRLTKYIWLDTQTDPPTPKYWKVATSTWTAVTVGALSLTDAEISTTAAIDITKLAIGTARQLLRTNAAGTATEWINSNSILNNNDVGLVYIDVGTSPPAALPAQNYLKHDPNGPLTKWEAPAFTDFPATNFLSLAQISSSGAVINDRIIFNGSAWAVKTPASVRSDDAARTVAVQNAGTLSITANFTTQFVHGQLAIPRFVRVVAVCVSADANYSVNDEVEISSFLTVTSGRPVFHVRSNASYVEVGTKGDDGGIYVMNRTGYNATTIAATKWMYKIYASM